MRLTGALKLAAAVLVTAALGVSAASAVVGRDVAPTPQSTEAEPGSDSIDRTASDPQAGPVWAVRVYDSTSGGACAELGRLNDGTFGQLDKGGAFHALALEGGGTCGDLGADPAILAINTYPAGAGRPARSVLFGQASAKVADVAVNQPGETAPTHLKIGPRGAIALPLTGTTAPRELPVTITLRDGRQLIYDWT